MSGFDECGHLEHVFRWDGKHAEAAAVVDGVEVACPAFKVEAEQTVRLVARAKRIYGTEEPTP